MSREQDETGPADAQDEADEVWDELDSHGCCARDEGHDGPCEWKCSDCDGTGRCPQCEHHGCRCDDVVQCEWCDGSHACPYCYEGWRSDE